MSYNEIDDKVVVSWESDTFQVSVRSYNQSELKLQIGPRLLQGGTSKYGKLGRLSLDETKFLHSHLGEAIGLMSSNN